MSIIRNIIFDFDGTLVDTAPLIVATMQATIKELKLPYRTESECRSTIGLRLEEIPTALWPQIPDSGMRYAKTYRRIFNELKRPLNVVCFPGVTETLGQLYFKGYNMAIASSRSHKSLAEYVEMFGIGKYFSMLTGGDDVSMGKPDPELVLTILKTCDWSEEESIVVGDAAVDILMGRAARCRTCGVAYGNGTVEDLKNAGADMIVASFGDLCSQINKIRAVP